MTVEMVAVLALQGKPHLKLSFPDTDLSRFESRDVCEDIIKQFNNTPVSKPGGEEHIMQIRYSDTHEQKMLKQQTAAARQFRAAEFEYGCLEARRAGLLPQAADHLSTGPKSSNGALGNDFEPYMTHNAS